ncbi:hypothetical protein BH24ACT10_BH24ACT10_03010 [soil metagenome]
MNTRTEQQHDQSDGQASAGMGGKLAFAWAFVWIPRAYGIFETAKKAAALFTG